MNLLPKTAAMLISHQAIHEVLMEMDMLDGESVVLWLQVFDSIDGLLRRAFLHDTSHVNHWGQVKEMPTSDIKKLVEKQNGAPTEHS